MKVWMSVSATKFYGISTSRDYGYLYISVTGMPEISVQLSYADAQEQLLKLSKHLNKPPLMSNNQYDPMITTRELSGFVDRE